MRPNQRVLLSCALLALVASGVKECRSAAEELAQAPASIPELSRLVPRTKAEPSSVGGRAAGFTYAAPEELGLSAARLQALGELVARWVQQGRIVGAVLLVVKDRKVVLHEGIGWSDREQESAMQPDSIFRLRSMTKPFTGTAALVLVDEGRLELQAPVARYLPAWDNQRSRAITVRDLLCHQSGFKQSGWPRSLPELGDLRSVVDELGESGPQRAPGAFCYSSVNTFTLGALVSQVSGLSLEEFVSSRILEPAGLDDTHIGFSPEAPWAGRMNPTYQRVEGRWVKQWTPQQDDTFPFFRASGGMLSTALDYARWLALWMDAAAGADPHGLPSESLAGQALRSTGSDSEGGYGQHWRIRSQDPLVFGHTGSDGTLGFALPSQDLILIYFTQSRGTGTLFEWLDAAREASLTSNPEPSAR